MTKTKFLAALASQLAGLPEADIQRFLDYYSEMIDDRMEETGDEAEAIAALGMPDSIAEQILSEYPLPKLVKQKMKPRRKMAAWEIVLLCVGSPIWLSLLIGAFVIVISLYAVAFSLVVSFFAGSVACGGFTIGALVQAVLLFVGGSWKAGLLYLGMTLTAIGLGFYLWQLALLIAKAVIRLTKLMVLAIKRRLIRKEARA